MSSVGGGGGGGGVGGVDGVGDQVGCLLLQESEFESRWSLQILSFFN